MLMLESSGLNSKELSGRKNCNMLRRSIFLKEHCERITKGMHARLRYVYTISFYESFTAALLSYYNFLVYTSCTARR
jgi:hypothetical protein